MSPLPFKMLMLRYFARPHEVAPHAPVLGPAAWEGPELASRPGDWNDELSSADLDELAAAAATAQARGLLPEQIDRACFALPKLGRRVARWRSALTEGPGVMRVRGLPVQTWGEDVSRLAYCGLAAHLGRLGEQNPDGAAIGEVLDVGDEAIDPMRHYASNRAIDFHCDTADVVGLLCLRPAQDGGSSIVASSVTVHNLIRKQAPHLASQLFQHFKVDLRGWQKEGGSGMVSVRAACHHRGQLRTYYHSERFRSVARFGSEGALSDETLQLLDLYDELAASRAVRLDMELQSGDIQFLSNHVVVHARTAYLDDPARRRHLLRLWLTLHPGTQT